MTPADRGSVEAAAWRRPGVDEAPLQRYLQTLRGRFGLIVGVLVVTVLAAVMYLAVADKVYEAEAEVLVSPVGNDDPVTQGLPLIRESNDPTRDVETAARLVTGRNVAERVRRQLRSSESAANLAESVDAAPVAQSNIVAVKHQPRRDFPRPSCFPIEERSKVNPAACNRKKIVGPP